MFTPQQLRVFTHLLTVARARSSCEAPRSDGAFYNLRATPGVGAVVGDGQNNGGTETRFLGRAIQVALCEWAERESLHKNKYVGPG